MARARNSRKIRAQATRSLGAGLLIAVFVAGCGAGEPGQVESTEIIAFADGDGSIYTIAPDGSGLRQLTATITDDRTAYASHPAVSPDGSRIAFTRGSAIAVMNADGTDQQVIAERGGQPAFSPDGSQIVFGCVGGICLINADGSDRRQLSPEYDGRGGISRSYPVFTPDGSKIVFNEAGYLAGFDTDGNGWFQILRDQHWNSDPAYSPDGTTIVFSSNRGSTDASETYAMTADGRDIRPLTTEFAVGAKFSPDGSKIVYTRGLTEPRPSAQIWVMNADGSDPRQLTSSSLVAQSPSWGGHS
ncbi:hypothetical protein EGT67_06155 [Prescottella agglutinans]|uniref:Uncharacterized protein n=1 Tax=Prescottella agglutinans TaxID=1644129 RepID=A0A438BJH6_9NOCA|nr:PD40 domain-containing protein [Prescottella agglutinans]RVW10725.1 hypothetical protein EGT67_06155 [Prescottella agglutinans]